ncbi:MAG: SH3 domain-containing protein [Lewinellaceae bacterium]|nr:SH3 domain-containing protein [Lewinellaceae bacterium]
MRIPRVESIIITVFFLCIALWAISKCSSRRSQTIRSERAELEEDERPRKPDTVFVPQQQTQQQPQAESQPVAAPPPTRTGLPKLENPAPATEAAPTNPTTVPGVRPTLSNEPQTTPAAAKYSTLFVTIDGLNMRKEPNRKSPLVARLKLDEQVFFLNKKSEKPEEINLGLEKVTDYWVNIRTKSGKEGWVFGAGVHYFKMKRKGVLE